MLIPNFNQYELELVVSLPLSGQTEELDFMLSYMIPANIRMTSTNLIQRTLEGTAYLGGVTVKTSYFTILSRTSKERIVSGNMNTAGGIVTMIERTIN